ncbi:MAG: hypothetical protein IJQ82_06480 [Selenomonadaceae bacterium]|nr:hypothetical protein [Selenomonadaceae bacterium]
MKKPPTLSRRAHPFTTIDFFYPQFYRKFLRREVKNSFAHEHFKSRALRAKTIAAFSCSYVQEFFRKVK